MDMIKFSNIFKAFDDQFCLSDLSFSIRVGEFVSIVGPSGSGKSTILGMISGIHLPDRGSIAIDNNSVFDSEHSVVVPSNKRKVSLVFQNYALWPHLSVFENIAYPMRIKKMREYEIVREVDSLLTLTKLAGKQRSSISQLSGGEQQRVAIARALACDSKLLLLDEPFSNIDTCLKEELRRELRAIQKKFDLTIILVTHDYSEALSLSDRIILLKDGRIVQFAAPEEIYRRPSSKFCASFFGKTNIVEYELDSQISTNRAACKTCGYDSFDINFPETLFCNSKGMVSIRPEDILLSNDKRLIRGKILNKDFLGGYTQYEIIVTNDNIFYVKSPSDVDFSIGEVVGLHFKQATELLM